MDLMHKIHINNMPTRTTQRAASDSITSRDTAIPSSPTGSEGHKTGVFIQSIKERARRSLSRDSPPLATTAKCPQGESRHGRRLSKSTALELLNRRNSGYSDDRSSVSRTPTTLSSRSSLSVNWRSQTVKGFSPLEPDSQVLRTKTPYIVITSNYLVKVKNHSDAMALFPQLEQDQPSATSRSIPEPLLVIPIDAIVSVFAAESSRYPFGFEVWWSVQDAAGFRHALFCFSLASEGEAQMSRVLNAVRLNNDEPCDSPKYPWQVEGAIRRLFAAEEPKYQHYKLEIFPVVPRGATRRDNASKSEDRSAKSLEGHSFYLAFGANLCFYIEASKGNNKRGEPSIKHSSFGLVTLQFFKGNWTPHEERFDITFRQPFKAPVTLELASRYYRQVIRVVGKADRCLKPAWPQTWQNLEVFRISGLKEPQYLVPRGNYGSIHRTLDAYIAAYRCESVDWEINWRAKFAPEFRLLPSKNGARYSPMQLLSVLKALRYNDYFQSLSFRDVDLSVLFNSFDRPARRSDVAYLSRSCVALGADEIEALRLSNVLHNEFHALAYCAETIRQIDFTNSFRDFPVRAKATSTAPLSVQFLAPVLNLLESDSTKCNHLILSGNALGPADIVSLIDILKLGCLQGLDISRCGLSDMDLRDISEAIGFNARSVQLLDISGNLGRIPAKMVPNSVELFMDLRELNLYGTISGDVQGPLLPFEALDRLVHLQELDISHFKVNEVTLLDLERYLRRRSWRLESNRGAESNFRRLVLNNCGITGKEASGLFNAIGADHGVHLFLSGNPLEDGIEYLAEAIRHSQGPSGLHMDMVEFRDERSYTLLIEALTATKHLSLLSLVGTAPTPSPSVPCSKGTLLALEAFFAQNKSISYLDMSGYSGKLDEGQLAKGFGRALRGVAKNDTITHLCVRNQNLHDDVGILGNCLRENRSLMVFDCQDNGFNLTSLQFLVQCLKDNRCVVDFPISPAEKHRIWGRILSDLQRPRDRSPSKVTKGVKTDPEDTLREVFEQSLADLNGYLDRNRKTLESDRSRRWNSEPSIHRGGEGGWPMEPEMKVGATLDEEQAEIGRRRGTLHSTAISINTSLSARYHVRPEEGMESPTDTVNPGSAASTSPPELASPATPEDIIFQTVLQNLKESGFDGM